MALCIVSGIAGLIGAFWWADMAGSAGEGSDMANWGPVGSGIIGFLVVEIGVFIGGAIFLAMNEQD